MLKKLEKNKQMDKSDFLALFEDLDELSPYDIKKEEVAANLSALLSFAKVNRSKFSSLSSWKKSRVSSILNGKSNLTFKTIWEFARLLGYEADINFRKQTHPPAPQPWTVQVISPPRNISTDFYCVKELTATRLKTDSSRLVNKIESDTGNSFMFNIERDRTLALTINLPTQDHGHNIFPDDKGITEINKTFRR